MHITSICMHARSGHCAGQAVSYCIYVLERSRKVCKRAKLVGMDMVRVDNKIVYFARHREAARSNELHYR